MRGSFYCGVQGLLLPFLCSPPAAAEVPAQLGEPAARAAIVLVCSLDRPIIDRNQTANATAFTDAPDRASLRYQWTASGGALTQVTGSDPAFSASALGKQPIGATIRWDPDGIAPGAYTLSAKVLRADGSFGSCSLQVVVSADMRSSASPAGAGDLGSEAVRAMLVKGREERKGYGLYSYILLGARTDDTNRERYQAVLQEYLKLEDVRLENEFELAQLNITYVPVDHPPPDKPKVQWVLDHYDFGRARFLLAGLPQKENEGDGPFIVSCRNPPRQPGRDEQKCLVQNLSTVPVSVIPFWMKQFRSQTTQQRVLEGRNIGTLMLNLRTLIAVAAEGLPDAAKAVTEIIQLKDSK